MRLRQRSDRGRVVAEFVGQRFRGIADDRQPAASSRSVRGERRHDDVATRLHGAGQMPQVRLAIDGIGQEMEHGAIVPDVYRVGLPVIRDVRFEPAGDDCVGAEPDLRAIERRAGHVQYADAAETLRQEMVDEPGIPASNIDQSSARAGARCLDQLE